MALSAHVLLLCLLACLAGGQRPRHIPIQHGITFTNGKYCPNVTLASPAAELSLRRLRSTGASWLSLIVTQYQRHHNSSRIRRFDRPGRVGPRGYYWFITASDAEVVHAINRAHALGLKVMLKPQIDLFDDSSAFWRGSIGMQCPVPPADATSTTSYNHHHHHHHWTPQRCARWWAAWFKSYGRMLLRYARLAEAHGVEQLSLSCELVNASPQEKHWRTLVARVRRVYSGILTDAANWGYLNQTGGEVFNKTWWDAVDVIGVDAYWPIAGSTAGEMLASWQPILRRLKALSDAVRRPIVFTEIGYCARNCSREAPAPSASDLQWQADHYEAALRAVGSGGSGSWLRGLFFWAWNTDPEGSTSRGCITPQHKPAEGVLRRFFGGETVLTGPHLAGQRNRSLSLEEHYPSLAAANIARNSSGSGGGLGGEAVCECTV